MPVFYPWQTLGFAPYREVARNHSHWRIAEVRLGAPPGVSSRSTSIRATSALSGNPSATAACSIATQNIGSRLIEVSCPAIVIERLVGLPKITSQSPGRSPQGRPAARAYARKTSRRMPARGA